ncbi:hypothetical protein [Streptomyces hiroshimensis]|uniref:Integral membrane protein n=1 Tax=Streptomyces hiroshimensis TaxID=66424 RepID=A0ABQ2YUG7_9ACTN|nr:hypothetical protein [Streptomyces hiroshimensis]GGX92787.1 hypothetical protein GCM10010324_43360 [Streptomyces hiroshimensis]
MPHPVARVGADLRLIRAAVFTAVCVLLSAGGHVLASCAKVPLWTLAAGFLAVLALAVPLAGRERSLPSIAAGLAAGQLALHTLFGIGQQGAGVAARQTVTEGRLISFASQLVCNQPHLISATDARRVITDAGLDPAVHPLQQSGAAAAGAGSGMHSGMSSGMPSGSLLDALPLSLPMLLGHLLAALAAGWLLRRGEVALWRVVALSGQSAREVAETSLVRALRAAFALVGTLRETAAGMPPVAGRRPAGDEERPATEPVLQHFVIRRGPPVFALAA